MRRATAGALGLAAAVAAVLSGSVRAADWTVAPTLTVAIDDDTNRALTNPPIPSKGLSMSVDTRLERNTRRLKLELHPRARLERYTDARISHTDGESLGGRATWRAGERSSIGVHTLIRDQSTLYAELTGTGLIHIGQRRRDEEADGTWSFHQTERRTLQLQGTYSNSTYHGAGAGLLSNYGEAVGTATESFAYSPLVVLSVSASAGNARTGHRSSTRFASLDAGFQWQITERAKLVGSGGVSRQTSGSLTNTGWVGDLTFSYASELGSIALAARRQNQPSGYGVFTQVDDASLSVVRKLAPRVSLESSVSVYRNTSVFHSPFISFTFADRTYSQAHVRLAWRESRPWTLAVQLTYGRQDSPRSLLIPGGSHAKSWGVSLQAVWAPLGLSLSR